MKRKKGFGGIGIVLLMLAVFGSSCKYPAIQDETSVQLADETSSGQWETMNGAASTYEIHIEELHADLQVPENMYTYRIQGIYRDWTGDINIHEFSTWIVITDTEYEEGTLAEELRDHYEDAAAHIVFILSLIPRELYPVEELCTPVFKAHDDVPGIAQDWYCKILYAYEFLDRADGRSYRKTEELSRIHDLEELKAFYAEKGELTGPWVEIIEGATIPAVYLGTTGSYITSFNESDDFYRDTIVNDRFWEIYSKAIEEWSASPEAYVYDEGEITPMIEQWKSFAEANGEYSERHQKERLTDIYGDSEQDIRIRAYCYARCVVGYEIMYETNPDRPMEEISLNDFTVLLLEWEHGQRSFIVYQRDYSGEFGFGYDSFVDLTASREYICRWE